MLSKLHVNTCVLLPLCTKWYLLLKVTSWERLSQCWMSNIANFRHQLIRKMSIINVKREHYSETNHSIEKSKEINSVKFQDGTKFTYDKEIRQISSYINLVKIG